MSNKSFNEIKDGIHELKETIMQRYSKYKFVEIVRPKDKSKVDLYQKLLDIIKIDGATDAGSVKVKAEDINIWRLQRMINKAKEYHIEVKLI